MSGSTCAFCGHNVPLAWSICPHCARPSLFPNVVAAGQDSERVALAERYAAARSAASARGCEKVVQSFEQATGGSKAVLARSLAEVDRLASSARELYSTYYKQIEAEVRLPTDDKWDRLRRIADEALFSGYKDHIRFAALSLDGLGVANYGECSIILRDNMIAHRSSVFEENSAQFMHERNYNPPAGSRAVWEQRAMLCVAKLGSQLQADTPEALFGDVLVRQGATQDDDRYVEVHVWGPMSSHTFERVVLKPRPRRGARKPSQAVLRSLGERLRQAGVTLQVV